MRSPHLTTFLSRSTAARTFALGGVIAALSLAGCAKDEGTTTGTGTGGGSGGTTADGGGATGAADNGAKADNGGTGATTAGDTSPPGDGGATGSVEDGKTSTDLGKTDTVTAPGSCAGRCNAVFDPKQTCQCNSLCVSKGDCCADLCTVCTAVEVPACDATKLACAGRCNTPYDKNLPCQCNTDCAKFKNCCADYDKACGACTPDCTNKKCGDDGCGTACGTCAGGESCSNGQCVTNCTPDCTNKKCGDNGCGTPCGSCGSDETCKDGQCELACVSDCTNKKCGDDGCGKPCGTCGSNESCTNSQCVANCTPDCTNKKCGDDGCGKPCGTCTAEENCTANQCVNKDPCKVSADSCECLLTKCGGLSAAAATCGGLSAGCRAAIAADFKVTGCTTCNNLSFPGLKALCKDPACANDLAGAQAAAGGNLCDSKCFCTPNCTNKTCGDDGCGGSCGPACTSGKSCDAGKCVDSCSLTKGRPLFCACSDKAQCSSNACAEVNSKSICTHLCTKDSDCEAGSGCKFTVSVPGVGTYKYCTP